MYLIRKLITFAIVIFLNSIKKNKYSHNLKIHLYQLRRVHIVFSYVHLLVLTKLIIYIWNLDVPMN